jgi:hypothetical protein
MSIGTRAAVAIAVAALFSPACSSPPLAPEVASDVVGTSADGARSAEQDASARRLCEQDGLSAARRLAAAPDLAKAYRTSAAAAHEWRIMNKPAGEGFSAWREHPDEALVAVCHYASERVMAPGPAGARDRYDALVLLIAEDGTIDFAQANDTTRQPPAEHPGDAPEGARRVDGA